MPADAQHIRFPGWPLGKEVVVAEYRRRCRLSLCPRHLRAPNKWVLGGVSPLRERYHDTVLFLRVARGACWQHGKRVCGARVYPGTGTDRAIR